MLPGMADDNTPDGERTAVIETVIAELRRRGVDEKRIQNALRCRAHSSIAFRKRKAKPPRQGP
jgi:hypothetical protein